MELNHLLLFVVAVSCLLLLIRAARAHIALPWKTAAAILLVSAAAWLIVPRLAGFIAFALWIGGVFLPNAWRNRGRPLPGQARLRLRITPAVAILLCANAGMFVAEITLGGSTNPDVLHKLGELDPVAVLFQGQYWRLFTALFLHYGVVHLTLNLVGLYLLGLPFEFEIGTARFTACYLFAGLLSGSTVVLLTRAGMLQPMLLVGASGAVMGIVGGWAVLLARKRDEPFAMQRLRNVIVILLMQTAFDLVTPHVSLSAHLAGFAAGVLFGLTFTRSRERILAA